MATEPDAQAAETLPALAGAHQQPAHDRPVYGISVAAELAGVNPQMLRAYEARGLIEPHRSDGGTRRYSGADLHLVHRITTLLGAGLNLAGIELVLLLEAENRRLRTELDLATTKEKRPTA